MRGSETLNRHATCAVVVDPLWDFIAKEGEFERGYPGQNESIRAMMPTLTEMVEDLRKKVDTILCASKYNEGQFGEHIQHLCTTEERRRSVIPEELFKETLTKTANSILTAGELGEGIWRVLTDRPHLILTGLTGTSCVRVSVDEIVKYLPGTHVYLPKDVIAIRDNEDSRLRMEKIYEYWQDPKQTKLHVFDSWRDIPLSA